MVARLALREGVYAAMAEYTQSLDIMDSQTFQNRMISLQGLDSVLGLEIIGVQWILKRG